MDQLTFSKLLFVIYSSGGEVKPGRQPCGDDALTSRRLPKAQRRTQLLEAAAAIVRTEGTDALTLAHVAAQAGVTKPIAYEHFGTRAGLLIALYRHFDARQADAVHAALKAEGRTLEQVADLLAGAYVDCALSAGPEFGAISDALSASEAMEDFRQVLREGYVDQFMAALAPHVSLPGRRARLLLAGAIGAADVLSQAAVAGRCSRNEAVAALSRILVGALT